MSHEKKLDIEGFLISDPFTLEVGWLVEDNGIINGHISIPYV